MTITEYFNGKIPSSISYEDMDNISNGISRSTIPWSEAGLSNPGQMQQLKQQRHVGVQLTPEQNAYVSKMTLES